MFRFVESNAIVEKVGAFCLPRDEAAVIDEVLADRVNDDAILGHRETERLPGERVEIRQGEVYITRTRAPFASNAFVLYGNPTFG